MKEFVLSGSTGTNLHIDYKAELNDEQLDVVLHGDGPCLVLAGAGSGKTRTITYRVAYLLERGVPPSEILLLTFTNKAAKEMMGRIEDLLGSHPSGLWGGTFHSVANRILRQEAARIGYTPSFTILDQDDAVDLIKLSLKDLHIDTKARRFPSPSVLQSIISYSRNASRSIEETIDELHPSFFDLTATIQRIAEVYAERKRAGNCMDFDDLLLFLSQMLREQPEVREALARRFRYVLVDEYQDTNTLQAAIVRDLASVHGNVLVVGDDAQSIYSFRAADIRNILDFPDRFPGTKTFRLQTNYRSTPEILELANRAIELNRDQFRKELKAVRPNFEKPSLVPTSDVRQEAQYIAEQILQLRDEGVSLKNIAVLFRAAHHSQALEMELARRDIPYEFRGGMKFFERAHVKDVVSYLRLMANPRDTMAWIRVLGHQVGIGAVSAAKITEIVQTTSSLHDVLQLNPDDFAPGRAVSGWRTLSRTLEKMVKSDGTPAALIRAIAASDYQSYLEAEYPNYAERLEDIEQFALFSETYTDLSTFLEEVSLKDDYGAVREEGKRSEEKMVLSTIHQAKGLEWEAVFVINLSDGAFPHPRALGEDGGLEEERRLFYVALTRAKKHLFLTYPITSGYETLEIHQPSLFLEELPKGVLEEVRVKRPAFASGGYEDDEPAIVLDAMGERKIESRPKRIGFLRNVDEL